MTFKKDIQKEALLRTAKALSLSHTTVTQWFTHWQNLNKPTATTSFAELMDTFPEAKGAAKKAAKTMIKRFNRHISELDDLREMWTTDIQKLHFKLQPAYTQSLNELIERLYEGYQKEIKKYQWQLSYLDNIGRSKPSDGRDVGITQSQIERAKSTPIAGLLGATRSIIICPFHADHKPSGKIYPDNHFYCFSCGKSADAIDVQMHLTGQDFKDAVRILTV